MNMGVNLDRSEILKKMMHYCAYQERCHKEVNQKLANLGVYGYEAGELITELIEQNYLNEQRFAISFAGGKFRQKSWGKNKIRHELQKRELSEYCIEKALSEIEEEDYIDCIEELVKDQLDKNSTMDLLLAKDKTLKYCTGRGFEIDLVLKELRKY